MIATGLPLRRIRRHSTLGWSQAPAILTRQLGSASHSKVIQGQSTIVRCFTLNLNTMGGQTQIL